MHEVKAKGVLKFPDSSLKVCPVLTENKENLKIKSNYFYSIIGLNNVLLSTFFIVFNDAKQYCGACMI